MKKLLTLTACLLLAGCQTDTPADSESNASASGSSISSVTQQMQVRDPQNGYEIQYPQGWALRENVHLVASSYEADGTAIVVPGSVVSKRTNFDQGYVHIAVMPECPQVTSQEPASSAVINNKIFNVARWSEGAAGSHFEGTTYVWSDATRCFVLTAYIKQHSLGLVDGETQFDQEAVRSMMTAIIKTFKTL